MKRVFQVVSMVFISVFFINTNIFAESLVLQSNADEGIDANWYNYPGYQNNYNYGNLNCLEITNNRMFQGRGLIKFNLPDEIAGVDILNASLSLYSYDTASSYDNTIYVNRAVSFWEELPAGTIFTPPAYDSLYQTSGVIYSSVLSWVDFNITDMVRFWAANPENNYGMALTTDELNMDRQICSYAISSDYSNAAFHPKLSIEYTPKVVPEPASCILFGIGALTAMLRKKKRALHKRNTI